MQPAGALNALAGQRRCGWAPLKLPWGEHTRLRSAGLNTKKHSWKEKASAPKRLQSTNMAFEKNISAIFFSTGLHFSIPEAVLRIYDWPALQCTGSNQKSDPGESSRILNVQGIYTDTSFFWKYFISLHILKNKF